jgi:hypothetical protein
VLLIALGLLLLQGPVLLHLLLVQHTTCEHGELVEVAPQSRVAVVLEPPSDRPQIKAGQRSGHEHCDALALRHRVPDVAPAIACASLQWIEPIVACGERAGTQAVPLLSLAPKGSPPCARGRSERA